jgi:hypothetical protein
VRSEKGEGRREKGEGRREKGGVCNVRLGRIPASLHSSLLPSYFSL